jgi:hypothetical protein
MRIFILALAIILFSSSSFAGKKWNSQTGANDFCLTIQTEDGTVKNENCSPLEVANDFLTLDGGVYVLRSAAGTSGATSLTTSQGTFSSGYSFVRKAIGSDPDFSTGVLIDGRAGETITILITECVEGQNFTLTPTTKTGFTSLVFEAVGDLVTLLYVNDTVGWVIVSQESVQRII